MADVNAATLGGRVATTFTFRAPELRAEACLSLSSRLSLLTSCARVGFVCARSRAAEEWVGDATRRRKGKKPSIVSVCASERDRRRVERGRECARALTVKLDD